MTNSTVFSLDIGTRSIVGLVLETSEQGIIVKGAVEKEHKDRAMVDGQIHHVGAVAERIKDIKEQLEQTHGPLKKACVAAAGRALKTVHSHASWDISQKGVLLKKDVHHLEIQAVQEAREALFGGKTEEANGLYCVGYSVVRYYLDEQEMGSLIDQRGQLATVEVIATFLPQVVVDSLISALHKADLELEALTLEPIAAMQVLVPESMRRLNIALVDIGAGTSDIALTDFGTVTAYGMVPVAGDEMTEAVSDAFLLDFYEAESVKKQVTKNGSATVADILGFEQTIDQNALLMNIEPAIDSLASAIAEEIMQLNKRAPQAVMLIGGGSLTPSLPEKLSQRLQLPPQRVAVRDSSALKDIDFGTHLEPSPSYVTPLGIASAALRNPIQYQSVHLNNQPVRMFDSKPLTVKDVFLASGFRLPEWYGSPGLGLIVTVNQKQITVPGERGHAPQLLVNEEPATLDTAVKNRDHITLQKGANGTDAALTVEELFGEVPSISVWLNGDMRTLPASLWRNKQKVDGTTKLKDGDKVEWSATYRLRDCLPQLYGREVTSDTISVTVGSTPYQLHSGSHIVKRNGSTAHLDAEITNGDRIDLISREASHSDQLAELAGATLYHSIAVYFNGSKTIIRKKASEWKRNGLLLDESVELFHNDHIKIEPMPQSPFIYQDVFGHVDIEVPRQGRFNVLKNGITASFQDGIADGDVLELSFEEE
ncbi:cell division FtsA domain-containing protein [Aureibacillus halotolerans]|uniref:Cell division protein FtsA n=1 Tax=Aureibacillus halotolerans TaxID=1508390 RepID=A0A4R6TZL3_9BACI|nr:cell division FtsA domain-containing protein [Aureibacillus halotolerans]TDQ39081.1 cell division protein FtsA [Aureibacillus halotolerans]